MKTRTNRATSLLLTVLVSSTSLFAKDAESLKEALAKGDASVNLRYRYELVDEDELDKNAHASTLRTALGYRTLPFKGFSVFIQAQNVAPIIKDDTYNNLGTGSLSNDVKDRPVIADPAQTRMQQVYLRLDGLDTSFDLGRREIFYGDHRFVGDVGWRQSHQAFDAVYVVNRSIEKATLSYTYADSVLRITGAKQDMSSHFLNGVLQIRKDISLELFGYLLDFEEAFALSSQTYGFRLLGAQPMSEGVRALFEAEYANEKDFQNNPTDFDANYLELVAGVGFKTLVNVKVGRELLGSDDGAFAFQTPLATGHKFNGWADKFLTTPRDGLIDWYVSADGKIQTVSWLVAYHDFSADFGGDSYGSEIDAQVTYPTSWAQVFAAKLALYRQDGFSTDTNKFWVWTQFSF